MKTAKGSKTKFTEKKYVHKKEKYLVNPLNVTVLFPQV